jgi:predicted metalloendopeptidase
MRRSSIIFGQCGSASLAFFWIRRSWGAISPPTHLSYSPSQSGLGLPSPEYYKKSPTDDPYLRAYATYLDRLLELAAADGALPAATAATTSHRVPRAALVRAALAFETEMAAVFVPKAELRDPKVYYEPVPSLHVLQELTDGESGPRLFRWQTFVEAYYAGGLPPGDGIQEGGAARREGPGVPHGGSAPPEGTRIPAGGSALRTGIPGGGQSPLPRPLVLSGRGYLSRVFNSVVKKSNVSAVQVYLQLQVLQEYARHLSDGYVEAAFEMNKVTACESKSKKSLIFSSRL